MKRSPLKRTAGMKSRRKPLTKIQKSAQGEECLIRLPGVCNFRTDTTVLCHSNELAAGKGMGLKAPDEEAAYGCCACHDVVDGRAPRPEDMSYELMLSMFREAQEQTRRILQRKGLLA
jgi:hypothetical protein